MNPKELETLLNQWGLLLTQLDRGYTTLKSDYYFKVKKFDRDKDQMYLDNLEIPSKNIRFTIFRLHYRWIYSIETNMSYFKMFSFEANLDQMNINNKLDFVKTNDCTI